MGCMLGWSVFDVGLGHVGHWALGREIKVSFQFFTLVFTALKKDRNFFSKSHFQRKISFDVKGNCSFCFGEKLRFTILKDGFGTWEGVKWATSASDSHLVEFVL